jgi:perosamine synthetase
MAEPARARAPERRTGQVRLNAVLPLDAALGRGPQLLRRPFPLDQPGVALTFSGTVAVYQAFQALGLPAGSVVLCPSYNCGHEIEPLMRLGLKIQCYRVTSDLEADIEDIDRRMDRSVKALLVTHFFGFGQRLDELRALCDRRGVFLVEDCAHALLSTNQGGNLGRVGDAAIFSIRKTLPLPNGGAVLFNNASLAMKGPLTAPPRLTTWLKACDLTRKAAADDLAREPSGRTLLPFAALAPLMLGNELLARLHPAAGTACYDPDDEAFDFDQRIMSWGISPFSLRMLDQVEWSGVARRRRENYRYLAAALQQIEGCEVMRTGIPDHTCPLFLPVLVSRRREVFRHLVQHRIHPAIWWDQKHRAVTWEEFPEAIVLKDRVLALPVHQDIETGQLDYLVDTLRRCSALLPR